MMQKIVGTDWIGGGGALLIPMIPATLDGMICSSRWCPSSDSLSFTVRVFCRVSGEPATPPRQGRFLKAPYYPLRVTAFAIEPWFGNTPADAYWSLWKYLINGVEDCIMEGSRDINIDIVKVDRKWRVNDVEEQGVQAWPLLGNYCLIDDKILYALEWRRPKKKMVIREVNRHDVESSDRGYVIDVFAPQETKTFSKWKQYTFSPSIILLLSSTLKPKWSRNYHYPVYNLWS